MTRILLPVKSYIKQFFISVTYLNSKINLNYIVESSEELIFWDNNLPSTSSFIIFVWQYPSDTDIIHIAILADTFKRYE